MRPLRGHFDGAAWNDAIDRWQGRKHQAMLALAASLLRRQAGEQEVLHTLGPADRTLVAGEAAHAAALEQLSSVALASEAPNHRQAQASGPGTPPAASVLWLYRWRGTHDQLVLTMVQGKVQGTAWLHAFE